MIGRTGKLLGKNEKKGEKKREERGSTEPQNLGPLPVFFETNLENEKMHATI